MIIYASFYEYETSELILKDGPEGIDGNMPKIAEKIGEEVFGFAADFVLVAKDRATLEKLEPFLRMMVEEVE